MLDSSEKNRAYEIAILVSIASVLQIAESFIPHPIPGLRLGLANMLTLVALVTLGFRAALEISILRTVLSALVMGTFMSPTFILSFLAAVVSSLVMGLLYWMSGFHRSNRFSLIGISILGALSHNHGSAFPCVPVTRKASRDFRVRPLAMHRRGVYGLNHRGRRQKGLHQAKREPEAGCER